MGLALVPFARGHHAYRPRRWLAARAARRTGATGGGRGGVIETVGRWGIVIAGIIILVWWVLLPFARWITTEYVFTSRRIITRAGLVARQGRDMPLSKINNVSFDVPAMGRFLNYGSLRIESAGEGDLVIDDVPNVEVIQREVYRLHEEDDERRRRGSAATGGDPVPPNDGT